MRGELVIAKLLFLPTSVVQYRQITLLMILSIFHNYVLNIRSFAIAYYTIYREEVSG